MTTIKVKVNLISLLVQYPKTISLIASHIKFVIAIHAKKNSKNNMVTIIKIEWLVKVVIVLGHKHKLHTYIHEL